MMAQPATALPWSFSSGRTLVLATLVGIATLTWGWWNASGTGDLVDQTRALVLAIVAAVVVLTGAFAWLSAGRRAIRVRKLAVLEQVEQTELLLAARSAGTEATTTHVTLPGSTRYHRNDCLLVRGKDVERHQTRTDAAAGRAPCEMCRP